MKPISLPNAQNNLSPRGDGCSCGGVVSVGGGGDRFHTVVGSDGKDGAEVVAAVVEDISARVMAVVAAAVAIDTLQDEGTSSIRIPNGPSGAIIYGRFGR